MVTLTVKTPPPSRSAFPRIGRIAASRRDRRVVKVEALSSIALENVVESMFFFVRRFVELASSSRARVMSR